MTTPPDMPPHADVAAPLPGETAAANAAGEKTPITATTTVSLADLRGCLGCLGVLGALSLLVLMLCAGAIIVSIQQAGSVAGGVQNAFIGAGSFLMGLLGGASAPRVITLPEIEHIRQLAQVTTVRFSYANVVSSSVDMPALLSGLYGEKLVMVAVGHVEAGIDLQTLSEERLIYDEDSQTIRLRLPAAVLLACYLNERESYIVERSSGVFAAPSPQLDTLSRRYAISQFRDSALEEGILAQAETQAQKVIEEFMALALPDDEVQVAVLFEPPRQDAPLPDTCQ